VETSSGIHATRRADYALEHQSRRKEWFNAKASTRCLLANRHGKAIPRDYIKATVGFEKLGEATGTQPKSLMRMFGPRGNPQARNLFGIIGYLQKQAGVELHVTQGPR
jgi:hypothetical protein